MRAASKTLRLFLQSMMLGLGAWLAIRGEVTPGIMIAASILLGRALAPIDQAVAQWPMFQRALQGRRSLAGLLLETPEEPERTPLPAPKALLEAENLVVAAPGAQVPAVRGVSFRLEPGHALGIAGPSASGKSTLVRALAGVWPPLAGKATLGGAALDQYGEDALARHVGWLPQEVVLFGGTVAENIARLDPEPDPDAVVDAAIRAGAHEMILALPGGYDFSVAAGGAALSGGQRQRNRARPGLLRRPDRGDPGRAGRASGYRGRRGAEPRGGGAEAARRRGHHRGAPADDVRRMRLGAGDGAGATAGPQRAGAARRHASRAAG